MLRWTLVLLLLAVSAAPVRAQTYSPLTSPAATRATDVSTIDSITAALYASISGTRDQPRQWERFHTLFHPNAHMIPMRCGATKCIAQYMTPAEYQQRADSLLRSIGFVEKELTRRIDRFGAMAQVYSSYASFRNAETAPFSRGINTLQLFWDGTRWWILNIAWDDERPNNPLPADMQGAAP
jgi:hypothetical protein